MAVWLPAMQGTAAEPSCVSPGAAHPYRSRAAAASAQRVSGGVHLSGVCSLLLAITGACVPISGLCHLHVSCTWLCWACCWGRDPGWLRSRFWVHLCARWPDIWAAEPTLLPSEGSACHCLPSTWLAGHGSCCLHIMRSWQVTRRGAHQDAVLETQAAERAVADFGCNTISC